MYGISISDWVYSHFWHEVHTESNKYVQSLYATHMSIHVPSLLSFNRVENWKKNITFRPFNHFPTILLLFRMTKNHVKFDFVLQEKKIHNNDSKKKNQAKKTKTNVSVLQFVSKIMQIMNSKQLHVQWHTTLLLYIIESPASQLQPLTQWWPRCYSSWPNDPLTLPSSPSPSSPLPHVAASSASHVPVSSSTPPGSAKNRNTLHCKKNHPPS